MVGRFAGNAFVDVNEVRDAVISAPGGYLTDRCIIAAEQFFCLVDAYAVEILLKCGAGYALEAARKITVAHTKAFCQFALVHILGIVVANVDHCVVNEGCCLIVRDLFG